MRPHMSSTQLCFAVHEGTLIAHARGGLDFPALSFLPASTETDQEHKQQAHDQHDAHY